MARPRARALSVTVRVHRGGVDGLILVEVEVARRCARTSTDMTGCPTPGRHPVRAPAPPLC